MVHRSREETKAYYEDYWPKHPEKWIWSRAKHRAKAIGVEFNILEEDITIPTHCPILGIELLPVFQRGARKASPSLDRIDPTKGYIKGNCRVISFRANSIKSDLTYDPIKALYDYISS